jgi:hypothetical protein
MTAASTPIVDWAGLIQVVWISVLASCAITVAFTIAVIGASRWTELQRARRSGLAVGYGLLGALGASLTGGAIILGLIYMTKK